MLIARDVIADRKWYRTGDGVAVQKIYCTSAADYEENKRKWLLSHRSCANSTLHWRHGWCDVFHGAMERAVITWCLDRFRYRWERWHQLRRIL